jgi:hypothetical protein
VGFVGITIIAFIKLKQLVNCVNVVNNNPQRTGHIVNVVRRHVGMIATTSALVHIIVLMITNGIVVLVVE